MSFRERVVYREGRVRPGWRIALFFLLFLFFAAAGQYAMTVLPRHPLQWGGLSMMTLAALLAGWIMLSRVDNRPFGALGFAASRRGLLELVVGLKLGGILIGLTVILLVLSGSAAFAPDAGTLVSYAGFLGWTLLFFGLAAAFEEVIFRGYPFQALVEWVGAWPAIVIASAIFALLHGQNPSVTPLALVNIFIAGVLLSIAYLRTRSLWFATGVHVGWNWTMSTLLDFPVSGLGFDTPLYSAVPEGPAWWTGGAFGPEAGLAGSLILVASTAWILRSRHVRPDPEMLRLRPIVDERLPDGGIA